MRPTEDMPVDAFGNRADVVVYGKGAVARLNPGQFYEHFIAASCRDVTLDIRQFLAAGDVDRARHHLVRELEILSPLMLETWNESTPDEQMAFLHSLQHDVLRPIIPAGAVDNESKENNNIDLETYAKQMAFRPPNKSPVTYRNTNGELVTTKDAVLIAPKQMIVLDKLDHKPMAVSGVLRQHHGLVAAQNKGTKYSRPSKEQAPRVIGETEYRSASAVMGGELTAEIADYSTNPASHREVIRAIYTADNPTAISNPVDRSKIRRGGRSVEYVRHFFQCAGCDIAVVPVRINNEESADGNNSTGTDNNG